MKRAGFIAGIVLILAAYVLGFWPQRQVAQRVRRQLAAVSGQLSQVEGQERLCRLQDHLLALIRNTSAKNYGEASALSTQFFDEAREEAGRQTDSATKAALESILEQRDAVTAALAKGDSSALGLLDGVEDKVFGLVNESMKGGDGPSPAGTPPKN